MTEYFILFWTSLIHNCNEGRLTQTKSVDNFFDQIAIEEVLSPNDLISCIILS